MPFASIPAAEPTTSRDKRLIIGVGLVLVLIFAGVGIWAAVRPGSYGKSAHGCVTVNVPMSMGGALIHGCGSRARSLCRSAYAGHDEMARLTRTQCQAAGIPR